jgi:hypothetical protein
MFAISYLYLIITNDENYDTQERKGFFACTGLFIEWNGGKTILTSASLLRESCYNDQKIVKNLRVGASNYLVNPIILACCLSDNCAICRLKCCFQTKIAQKGNYNMLIYITMSLW